MIITFLLCAHCKTNGTFSGKPETALSTLNRSQGTAHNPLAQSCSLLHFWAESDFYSSDFSFFFFFLKLQCAAAWSNPGCSGESAKPWPLGHQETADFSFYLPVLLNFRERNSLTGHWSLVTSHPQDHLEEEAALQGSPDTQFIHLISPLSLCWIIIRMCLCAHVCTHVPFLQFRLKKKKNYTV